MRVASAGCTARLVPGRYNPDLCVFAEDPRGLASGAARKILSSSMLVKENDGLSGAHELRDLSFLGRCATGAGPPVPDQQILRGGAGASRRFF
jgi:hypothetical protein